MKSVFWQNIRYYLLLALAIIIIVAFHPYFINMSKSVGLRTGNILSPYISLLFVALFVLCVNVNSILKSKEVRHFLLIFIFIIVAHLAAFSFFDESSMFSEIRAIGMCLIAIMIGWQLNLKEKRLNTFFIVFSLLSLFVGLIQVTQNIGGFRILDHYQVEGKNTFGVILASSSVILLFLGLNGIQKKGMKVLWLSLAILSIVILLTIRARSSALSVMLLILYVFYQRYKGSDFIFYVLIFLFLAVVLYLVIPASVGEYVMNSFFQNQEDDVTSGRTGRNALGWAFFLRHFWFGNLTEGYYLEWIHNFLLDKLFKYGIVLSFPLLWIYFSLLIRITIRTIKCDNRNNYNIGYFVVLIPFIVSMAEPTMPFGPGTGTILSFLLFGVSLRNSYNEKNGLLMSANMGRH